MFEEEGDSDEGRYLKTLTGEIQCTQRLPFGTEGELAGYKQRLEAAGELTLAKLKEQPLGQYFYAKYMHEVHRVPFWSPEKLITASIDEARTSCSNFSTVESSTRRKTLLEDVQRIVRAARARPTPFLFSQSTFTWRYWS